MLGRGCRKGHRRRPIHMFPTPVQTCKNMHVSMSVCARVCVCTCVCALRSKGGGVYRGVSLGMYACVHIVRVSVCLVLTHGWKPGNILLVHRALSVVCKALTPSASLGPTILGSYSCAKGSSEKGGDFPRSHRAATKTRVSAAPGRCSRLSGS